ncbi:hypothetical protein SY85_18075 [Flavisolibacter tropicus]|uniref:Uncharacterized protein n=1 Tax=Flavisolibacter tropicus TaxID=1492898 RepID=A0A172TYS5_9BACT|nr:hypothetical protein SY85_18075 [Flavisolibacter tropicus]
MVNIVGLPCALAVVVSFDQQLKPRQHSVVVYRYLVQFQPRLLCRARDTAFTMAPCPAFAQAPPVEDTARTEIKKCRK